MLAGEELPAGLVARKARARLRKERNRYLGASEEEREPTHHYARVRARPRLVLARPRTRLEAPRALLFAGVRAAAVAALPPANLLAAVAAARLDVRLAPSSAGVAALPLRSARVGDVARSDRRRKPPAVPAPPRAALVLAREVGVAPLGAEDGGGVDRTGELLGVVAGEGFEDDFGAGDRGGVDGVRAGHVRFVVSAGEFDVGDGDGAASVRLAAKPAARMRAGEELVTRLRTAEVLVLREKWGSASGS